jgi:hypothetical protein
VILFMAWLDAQPRYIAKYADHYKTLYPTASIILVTTSTAEAIVRSEANNIKNFSPVAAALLNLSPDAKILLHTFSNGGISSAVLIAEEYHRSSGAPLPIQAQIFDSCPGSPHFWSDIRAISAGLPRNPVIRTLGMATLTVMYTVYIAIWWATGSENPVLGNRALVNRGELFSKRAPRAYIYSREDAMVEWTDVESHIADAKSAGYDVSAELFEGTQHVSHMPKDSGRYWGIVQSVWKSSFGRQ